MSFSEIYQSHHAHSTEFYKKLIGIDEKGNQEDYPWNQKRKLSKICAFSFNKLQTPVRGKKCTQIKCVYEYNSIKALFKEAQENKKNSIKCLSCGVDIKESDLFYDSEITRALQNSGPCYLTKQDDTRNNTKQPYCFKNKEGLEIREQIEEIQPSQVQNIEKDQNFQILSILGLTLYKQRMETLKCLEGQQMFKKFAEDELSKEKNKYK